MIGLAGLHDGAYTLVHPIGSLYLLVRRRRIVYAELAPWDVPTPVSWKASASLRPAGVMAGYRALAEKVVMTAESAA